MDVNNVDWVASRVQDCKDALAFSGYDGCFLDMLGSGLLFPGYLSSSPINTSTGLAWTHAEWVARMSQVASRMHTGLSGVTLICNGVNNGRRYFSSDGPSEPLVAACGSDGIVAEMFTRLPEESPNTVIDARRWKQDVDMLVDAERNGNRIYTMTKVYVPATDAQIIRWRKFSLASFMLGTSGASRYGFVDLTTRTHLIDHAWNHPSLGAPKGTYYSNQDGTYQRDFQLGTVLVNPTPWPVTIRLSNAFTTLDGSPTTPLLVLSPGTGEVLKLNDRPGTAEAPALETRMGG